MPAVGISGQTGQPCLAVDLHLDCKVRTWARFIPKEEKKLHQLCWAILGETSLKVKLIVVIYLLLLLSCSHVELFVSVLSCSVVFEKFILAKFFVVLLRATLSLSDERGSSSRSEN